MRYCSNTNETKNIKKLISKFSSFDIDTHTVRGKVNVIGYRKYQSRDEFDIEFIGEINARVNRKPSAWFGSEIKNQKNISKIKVNRFIKKSIFNSLRSRMRYFGIEARWYSDIKKIKWI